MSGLDLVTPDFMRDEEIVLFQRSVGGFLDEYATTEATEVWRKQKSVGKDVWRAAGEAGL